MEELLDACQVSSPTMLLRIALTKLSPAAYMPPRAPPDAPSHGILQSRGGRLVKQRRGPGHASGIGYGLAVADLSSLQ